MFLQDRSLAETSKALFGDTVRLLSGEHQGDGIHVRLLITSPHEGAASKSGQHVFINRRPVKCAKVCHHVNALLRAVQCRSGPTVGFPKDAKAKENLFPAFLCIVDIPAHLVDVNVETDKSEVELQEWEPVLQAVQAAAVQAWHAFVPASLLADEALLSTSPEVQRIARPVLSAPQVEDLGNRHVTSQEEVRHAVLIGHGAQSLVIAENEESREGRNGIGARPGSLQRSRCAPTQGIVPAPLHPSAPPPPVPSDTWQAWPQNVSGHAIRKLFASEEARPTQHPSTLASSAGVAPRGSLHISLPPHPQDSMPRAGAPKRDGWGLGSSAPCEGGYRAPPSLYRQVFAASRCNESTSGPLSRPMPPAAGLRSLIPNLEDDLAQAVSGGIPSGERTCIAAPHCGTSASLVEDETPRHGHAHQGSSYAVPGAPLRLRLGVSSRSVSLLHPEVAWRSGAYLLHSDLQSGEADLGLPALQPRYPEMHRPAQQTWDSPQLHRCMRTGGFCRAVTEGDAVEAPSASAGQAAEHVALVSPEVSPVIPLGLLGSREEDHLAQRDLRTATCGLHWDARTPLAVFPEAEAANPHVSWDLSVASAPLRLPELLLESPPRTRECSSLSAPLDTSPGLNAALRLLDDRQADAAYLVENRTVRQCPQRGLSPDTVALRHVAIKEPLVLCGKRDRARQSPPPSTSPEDIPLRLLDSGESASAHGRRDAARQFPPPSSSPEDLLQRLLDCGGPASACDRYGRAQQLSPSSTSPDDIPLRLLGSGEQTAACVRRQVSAADCQSPESIPLRFLADPNPLLRLPDRPGKGTFRVSCSPPPEDVPVCLPTTSKSSPQASDWGMRAFLMLNAQTADPDAADGAPIQRRQLLNSRGPRLHGRSVANTCSVSQQTLPDMGLRQRKRQRSASSAGPRLKRAAGLKTVGSPSAAASPGHCNGWGVADQSPSVALRPEGGSERQGPEPSALRHEDCQRDGGEKSEFLVGQALDCTGRTARLQQSCATREPGVSGMTSDQCPETECSPPRKWSAEQGAIGGTPAHAERSVVEEGADSPLLQYSRQGTSGGGAAEEVPNILGGRESYTLGVVDDHNEKAAGNDTRTDVSMDADVAAGMPGRQQESAANTPGRDGVPEKQPTSTAGFDIGARAGLFMA